MRRSLVIVTAVALCLLGLSCGIRNTTTAARIPSAPTQTKTADRNLIPAGTSLIIRTNESIETRQAGKTYSAEVAENIVNQSGQILVPRGSPAELVVLETSGGGTVGTPALDAAEADASFEAEALAAWEEYQLGGAAASFPARSALIRLASPSSTTMARAG